MPKNAQTENGATAVPVTELFFALIRCGIGKERQLPVTPSTDEWKGLFDIAKKQTLVGIAFAGIEQLPPAQRPSKEILLPWYQLAQTIRKTNSRMNKSASLVSQKFKSEGFNNCILKGQGIAQLYPDPTLRTPGDIDIWLDGDCDRIIDYVKKYFPACTPTYHHVDFPVSPGLEIEIHYRPSWMYSRTINTKLQKFFTDKAAEQFENTISTPEGTFPAPTLAFNRVYILLHIYRHLFFEGIGLRQILDYYYIISREMNETERAEFLSVLQSLRLNKFAGALMHVLQRIFALDDAHMPVTPNKKLGEFLLHEIMIAGNFGKHDHRYRFGEHKYSLKRATETIRHNYTLLTRFPSETLWSPYFKAWHYFWRKKRTIK